MKARKPARVLILGLILIASARPAWAQDEEPGEATADAPTEVATETEPAVTEEAAPEPTVAESPSEKATEPRLAEPPVEEAPAPKWWESIVVQGLVDAYFGVNFNFPESHGNALRNFDVRTAEASLSYVELAVMRTAAPVGFRFDLGFGPTADMVHASESVPGMGGRTAVSSFNNLQQAYVSYLASPKVTIDIGKFVTAAGAEVIEAKDNWNYSRSFLFSWAIPYYHAGVRAAIAATPELTVTIGALNGWNNVLDNNNGKTGQLSVAYVKGATAAYLNYYGGPELADDDHLRHLIDATFLYNSPSLSAYVNADFGLQTTDGDSAKWFGVAAAAKLPVGDKYAAVLRAEFFRDDDGFATGAGSKLDLIEVTATGELKPSDGLALRAEFRFDRASEEIYVDKDGEATKNQPTFTVGALAWF